MMFYRISLLIISILFSHASFSTVPQKPTPQEAALLLNRFSFGPRLDEIESLAAKGGEGLSSWFESQMNPSNISDTGVEKKLAAYKTLTMNPKALEERYIPPQKSAQMKSGDGAKFEKPNKIIAELIAQRLIRATESSRQMQEVLTDFWFNHFNVDSRKGRVKWLLSAYEREAIRPHVFGKFRELLGAVAKSPAMLVYLDNIANVKDGANGKKSRGINENYARELLELHTVGVDGGYTQADIREVARAFTGWGVDNKKNVGTFTFRARIHDQEKKSVLGQTLDAGRGIEDGEQVLDILSKHPATARYIAKKLAVKFISDHPDETVIKKISDVFMTSDGDLKELYRTIFKSDDFWKTSGLDKKKTPTKTKMPLEFVISSIRALNGTLELGQNPDKARLNHVLEQMGQPLYRCQPPTGFRATAENWVNAGALVTRINFSMALAESRLPEVNWNVSSLKKKIEDTKHNSPAEQLELLNLWILQGTLSAKTKEKLLNELNLEQKVAAEHHPEDTAVNLPRLLGLILGSPEFQRR